MGETVDHKKEENTEVKVGETAVLPIKFLVGTCEVNSDCTGDMICSDKHEKMSDTEYEKWSNFVAGACLAKRVVMV